MSETTVDDPAPAREEGSAGVRDVAALLEDYHRVTGLRFRALHVDGEKETLLHDSLPEATVANGAGASIRRSLCSRSPSGEVSEVTLQVDAGSLPSEEALGFLEDWLQRHLREDGRIRSYAEELGTRREEIALLTSISETLGSVIDLDRAARVILREVVEVMDASRATLWRHRPEVGELLLLASQGRTDPVTRSVPVGERSSLVARVFESQRPLLVRPDGTGLEALPEEARSAASGYDGRGLLAVPVTYSPPEGEPRQVGVLGLVGRSEGEPFGEGDLRLVTAIASQIGAAIENGRLVREELQRERMAAELRLAHELQLTLLPDPRAYSDLFPIAARCAPAESVGGDFFQLVRLPGGRLGVMVGDVTSHGITAALLMAHAMSAASACAREAEDPGEALGLLDRELRRELTSAEMFVTVFYGVFEPDGSLRYASGGHPHAYLLGDGDARRLEVQNLPLGVGATGSFETTAVPASGSTEHLLVFTDGLFESLGPPRSSGEERVVGVTRERLADGGSEEEALDAIFELCAREGVEGACAEDDRTALLLRR